MTMTCVWPATPGELRDHLFLIHGIWTGDVKGRGKAARESLTEAHRSDHTERWCPRTIPHTHPGLEEDR